MICQMHIWEGAQSYKAHFYKGSSRYAKIQKFQNNFLNLSILRCNFWFTNCAHVLQKSKIVFFANLLISLALPMQMGNEETYIIMQRRGKLRPNISRRISCYKIFLGGEVATKYF